MLNGKVYRLSCMAEHSKVKFRKHKFIILRAFFEILMQKVSCKFLPG